MHLAGALTAAKDLWRRLRDLSNDYLANRDPLAASANAGAFLVWGNQPFYPVYVWLLVGRDAWPSLLTWLSTPAFFVVPFVSRHSSIAGRILFVIAGVANTLLSTKAFGLDTKVAWFLVPCLILALGFFRKSEWKTGACLTIFTLLAAGTLIRLGAPLHQYGAAEARSLGRLNLWSAAVLSLYLIYAAVRPRLRKTH